METPRVQSLLAALALLTCSSWSAGKTKSPALALPSWQAAEEPATNWMTVSYTDPATNKGSLVYCRRSDCRSGKKTGMAPLYRITQVKRETFWVDVKVPRNAIVFGRTINLGTKTERQRADKVFYSSELSNYQYDLATNEISQGNFRRKSDIFDALAKHDERSWRVPSTTLMIVSAPQSIAKDVVARKHQTKPGTGKPGTAVTPGRGKKPRDVVKDPATGVKDPATGVNQSTAPAKDSETALDMKELDMDEFANLTKAEKISYTQSLNAAKGKQDPQEIAKVIAQYREQAKKNKLPDVKDMKDFESLTPAQKNLFCDKLQRPSTGGAGSSHDEKALDEAKTADKGTTQADGTFSGARGNMVATVPPAPVTKLPEGELKKLAEACDTFLAGKPSAGGSKVAQGDKVPDPSTTKAKEDCEKKDKDGKCVTEKKADPNEWLSVKTGAVGILPGVMVGSFFGPVGIVIGAAVGFALFWGLSKLS